MPPQVVIDEFLGLTTFSDPDQGELGNLTKAQNVLFDRADNLESRPGIRFYARGPQVDSSVYGRLAVLTDSVTSATHTVNSAANLTIGLHVDILADSNRAVVASNIIINNIVGTTITFNTSFTTTGSGNQSVFVVGSAAFRQTTYYVGELRLNDGKVYWAFNSEPVWDPNGGGQFFWGNTVETNQTSTVTSGSTSPGGLSDTFGVSAKRFGICRTAGAQYNEVLMLPNGMRYRIITGNLDTDGPISGFPVFPDGWGSMATHKDRIFAAPKLIGPSGTTPSRVYFSVLGTSATWNSTNFFDVGPGTEDGAVTQMVSFQGRLIIFKAQGMWILETTGAPTSWSLRMFSDKGCVGRCATVHDTGVYWVGQKGAFVWDGVSFTDIGAPIQDIFDNNNVVDDLNCNSCIHEDKFYVWIRLANGSKKILCFDINLKKWTEIVTPLETINYNIVNLFARPRKAKYIKTTVAGAFTQSYYAEDYGPPGVFMTMQTPEDRPQVYSMKEDNVGSDATFLAIGPPTTYTERGMTVDVQTKFSDLTLLGLRPVLSWDSKKRVHLWEMEWQGPSTTITQYDEEGRSKAVVVTGTGQSLVKIGGIGYCRKLSLRFVSTSLSSQKMRLKRIWAKVTVQGNQISNEVNQYA